MRIERVQIEEGFLDGLDVSFASGLNVVIGERGTGKTSLIELLRFCLGVPGFTSDSAQRSLDHALSILGSGQVSVTIFDGNQKVLVTRTASDESPRMSVPYVRPIIFSQTEIESIGLRAQGRIWLIDSFGGNQEEMEARESEAASEIRSVTAEAEALRREIDELASQVEEIPSLDKQIAELAPQEHKLAEVSADANEKKSQLDAISARIAASSVGVDAMDRFLQSVSRWQSSLSTLSAAPFPFEPWPAGAGPDPLAECRARIERARDHLNKALRELEIAVSEAKSQLRFSQDNKFNIEDRARELRKEVETLQVGAGAIIRQGQQLRERRAQRESLMNVLAERKKALKSLLEQRNAALDRLDSIRERRFSARNAVATQLTETLGPRIRVMVSRAGQFDSFAAAIADALRGSGLRYNELSLTLAGNVSPRELLESVDANDYDLLADATGITKDRAARALGHLRECNLGALATVSVEDIVALHLLDGSDYKGIAELSTGQRCTVVLPLVLRHTERVLIVDQPEDHIDNAFITDTLIVSVLARGPDSQIMGDRGLAVAAIALLELAAVELAASVVATVRAQKPIGPSPLIQGVKALVFGAVEREECVEADSSETVPGCAPCKFPFLSSITWRYSTKCSLVSRVIERL